MNESSPNDDHDPVVAHVPGGPPLRRSEVDDAAPAGWQRSDSLDAGGLIAAMVSANVARLAAGAGRQRLERAADALASLTGNERGEVRAALLEGRLEVLDLDGVADPAALGGLQAGSQLSHLVYGLLDTRVAVTAGAVALLLAGDGWQVTVTDPWSQRVEVVDQRGVAVLHAEGGGWALQRGEEVVLLGLGGEVGDVLAVVERAAALLAR